MNIDLHCHSTTSDGLLSPSQLLARAAKNRVDILALTDHDELGGLDEARRSAIACGIRLINGAEISVTWNDQSVHIVGLGLNPHCQVLVEGLQGIRSGRDERARRMGDDLAKIGIYGAYEGAKKYVGNPDLVGRAHFARFLVELGIARDVGSVFEHYLVRGKPGFVEHEWANLEQTVGWIHAAGGLAVIAHPGRSRLSKADLTNLLDAFKDLGGDGIEVVSGQQNGNSALEFARVARHYGFLASRGSDFHGAEESAVDIGKAEDLPPDLTPVWMGLV